MKKLLSVFLIAAIMAAMCSLSISASAAKVDIKKTSANIDIKKTSAQASLAKVKLFDNDEDYYEPLTIEKDNLLFYVDEEYNIACVVEYTGTAGVVDIPSSIDGYTVCAIMSYVFYLNESIEEVHIPDTVEYIGESAFAGCDALAVVDIKSGVYVDSCAFDGTMWLDNQPDGDVYISDTYYSYKGEMPDNTSVTIKSGTTGISSYAFEEQSGLVSVSMPDSLQDIGYGAFMGCENLQNVNIPNSVTYLPVSVFDGCVSLACIEIPQSVTSIEEYAFYGCSSLENVYIPEKVNYIGSQAFYNCYDLSSVTISNKVADLEISSFAFENCYNLTDVILPQGVCYISDYAFGYYDEYDEDEDEYYDYLLDGFIIYGYADTTAQEYADGNNIPFVEIGDYDVFILGDADASGKIDIMDATTIQMHLAKIDVKDYLEYASDVDEDNNISILDATYIQMYLAKFATNTNIGDRYTIYYINVDV